jgi:uncharacterized protein YkwD
MMMSMARRSLVGLVLAVTLAWLPAGCPPETATSSSTPGLSLGGSGVTTSSNPVVGPPTSTGSPGDTGSSTGESSATSPVAVGGDTAGIATVGDALSVKYQGCDEPQEGTFWRAEILRLVNQERQLAGAGTVVLNDTLEAEATQYACEMIAGNFFAHVNPQNGSHLRDRAAEFGYDFWIIGENLAAGQRTPAEVVSDWMDSPCHRENVLNPAFTELGVGVRIGGDYGFYWVQEFGRPLSSVNYSGPAYHDPDCTHTE